MELTISELQELTEASRDIDDHWVIGNWYLIRTVTMIQTGKLKSVGSKELVLTDACWIADTGRFHDCLKNPETIKEAEPFIDDVIVGRGAIVDATKWHGQTIGQK